MAESGSNLLPIDNRHSSLTSPIFNYPYSRTREALDKLARFREINAWHGHKMRYVNPVNGGWAMPTMATMIRLLPAGFATQPYRSSDSMVFIAAEGHGEIRVGKQQFAVAAHDVVVVPGWTPYTLQADSDFVLFSYSDRAAQEKLGFFREHRF